MKVKLKETKGITLVTLAITIVVILILSSITINATLGKNGLITTMREAEKNEILAQEEGQVKVNELKGADTIAEDGVVKVTDENGPDLEVRIKKITKDSFTVKVTVTEKQSGIKLIEYSIDNGETYVRDITNPIATSYEFTNLTENTEYNVKVRATDNENHVVEVLATVNTLGTISIEDVSFVSKTTNSISISAMATDEELRDITYTLYVGNSKDGTYTKKETVNGRSGYTVILKAEELSEYTTYYYYVEASNGTTIVVSSKGSSVRTYCSGTTITCSTTYCPGGGYYSCSTCSGKRFDFL